MINSLWITASRQQFNILRLWMIRLQMFIMITIQRDRAEYHLCSLLTVNVKFLNRKTHGNITSKYLMISQVLVDEHNMVMSHK